MRNAVRLPLAVMLAAAVAAPVAQAAGPTATTAAPAVTQTAPPQQPGPAFGPIDGLTPRDTQTQTAVNSAKRPDDEAAGRSTLLILSIVALVMIFSVAGVIWYENRHGNDGRKRRHRMRSGRTPQPVGAGAEGRRGPPPPPRKRRAQAAKRKKR